MRHAQSPHDAEWRSTPAPRPPGVLTLLVMHAAKTEEILGR
jgi:hypothetical protein